MFAILVVSMLIINTFASGELKCGFRVEERLYLRTQSSLYDYEWNAIIFKKDGNKIDFKCGGALISTQHILTSATCVSDITNTKGWYARLSEHDLSKEKDCEYWGEAFECQTHVDYAIEKVTPHENFRKGPNKIDNDIAIIKLATAVNITDGVSTACLPYPDEKTDSKQFISKGEISGWKIGSSDPHENIKHKGHVTIISNEECQALLKNTFVITDNNVCVKSEQENPKYLYCSTDLGGPLTRMNKKYRYALIGVMSHAGSSCEYPAVFTKVENYLDWIKQHM